MTPISSLICWQFVPEFLPEKLHNYKHERHFIAFSNASNFIRVEYPAVGHVFNFLLCVWKCDETLVFQKKIKLFFPILEFLFFGPFLGGLLCLFVFVFSCNSAHFWLVATQHSGILSSGYGYTGLTVKFTDRELREQWQFVAMLLLIFIRGTLKKTISLCFISKYLKPFLWLLEEKMHLYSN